MIRAAVCGWSSRRPRSCLWRRSLRSPGAARTSTCSTSAAPWPPPAPSTLPASPAGSSLVVPSFGQASVGYTVATGLLLALLIVAHEAGHAVVGDRHGHPLDHARLGLHP